MIDKVIDILTSFASPKKVCAIGNEAVARGALEANVDGVFSYPGTPSTEISEIFNHIFNFQGNKEYQQKYPELTEHPVYFEYSINEKIAMEKAIAYSIGNKAAMCVMKNVGMNVASDPLMSITYQTIVGPLVVVVCDDPGCHSSSNEQDSRYWGQMASVPVFNPATPEDAYQMIQDAFRLSEELKLPVIVRLTTRVSHTRGVLSYNQITKEERQPRFERLPEHINIPARTAAAHQKLLGKLQSESINPFFESNNSVTSPEKATMGIISSGVATVYAVETLSQNGLDGETALLDLGLIHPFPEKDVLAFLQKDFKKFLVLEELEPIIENSIRSIAQKNNIDCEILGKGFSGLTSTGEYNLDIIGNAIKEFSGKDVAENKKNPLPNMEEFTNGLPPRPPTLCAGCPHRATFYAMKLAVPKSNEMVLCGDIGCFGLGALPPLQMIDTINHMGMGISMAQGLSVAFSNSKNELKTIALVGDGTFFHSGIASLLNAVYTRANMLLIIFDNRTIGMTGHQNHPGANSSERLNQMDITKLVQGMGVESVATIDPLNQKDAFNKMIEAMDVEGVSVIVSKSQCVFLPGYTGNPKQAKVTIDHDKCNNCFNHSDHTLACSRCGTPEGNIVRSRAKMRAEVQIHGEEQLCPANICNHGFFGSIQEGDYKSAIEIVRDKMLFSRTCGDICHRPCELYASGNHSSVVPIKGLKKFVSSIDENFTDFSKVKERVENAEKKGKRVAIIGAGPAGLSAAYDLIQFGYEVTVLEKEKEAGGLIKYAIPEFRMDKKGFDFEVSQLAELGVNFSYNTALGKDTTLEKLSGEYDAVLLAIGMGTSKTLPVVVDNIPQEKRLDAISFLKEFNTGKPDIEAGSTILVIGGGNSAMDAARAAKELDEKNTVIVSCIETREDMPAFAEEINHVEEEGIQLIPDSFVDKCSANKNLQFELNTYSTKATLQTIETDYVIVAIGQHGEQELYGELSNKRLADDYRIKTDKAGGFTEFKNVFVAGDLCAGNHISVIGAIASGKKAVTGIRKMLEDYSHEYEGQHALERLNSTPPPVSIPTANVINGSNISKTVQQYNLHQNCWWCNHCIDDFGCPAMIKKDGKVHIDEAKCTNCGLCIDVCPNGAIQWEDEIELAMA